MELAERSLEYRKLAKYNAALRKSDGIQFDGNLSFLKGFVDGARKMGAKEYQPSMVVAKSAQ